MESAPQHPSHDTLFYRALGQWSDRVINIGVLFLLVVLPWQTRWIAVPAFLHGGYWEYGTISLYVTEFLIVGIACIRIIHGIAMRRSVQFSFRLMWNTIRSRPSLVVMGLIGVWIMIGIVWAPRTTAGISWIQHAGIAVLFGWIVMQSSISRVWMLSAITIGIAISSALGGYQFITQRIESSTVLGISAQASEQAGVSVVESDVRRWLRAYGSFPSPNILGAWALVGLIAGLLVLVATNDLEGKYDPVLRLGSVVSIPVLSAGLWLSFSRAAWVSWMICLLGLWVWVLITHKRDWIIPLGKWTALCALMLVMLASVFREPFVVRTSSMSLGGSVTPFRLEQKSNQARVAQWQDAWQVVLKTKGLGTGVNNYTAVLGDLFRSRNVWELQPLHTSIVLAVIEIGVIGLWLLLWLGIPFFWKQISRPLGWIVLISFLPTLLFDHYWWTLYPGMLGFALMIWLSTHAFDTPKQLRIFGE